jgi:hypothetical protein
MEAESGLTRAQTTGTAWGRARSQWSCIAFATALLVSAVAGCSSPASGSSLSKVGGSSPPHSPLWTLSDRGIKTDLIMDMKAPPELLVLGGSRALRFQPSYIRRLTGLSAFNGAVTRATPQDEWCFVNLLHSRFPARGELFVLGLYSRFAPTRPIRADSARRRLAV